MTKNEWKEFQTELFTAFPSFGEYVSDRSPNPAGTLEVWYKTLADVSYVEAKSVLDTWLSGTVEPPKAFEKDYVAILIKSRVGFKRSEDQRYRTAKTMYDEKLAIAERRKSYQQNFADLEDMFEFATEICERKLPLHEQNKLIADEFYLRESEVKHA